jgi:hypothetical protein
VLVIDCSQLQAKAIADDDDCGRPRDVVAALAHTFPATISIFLPVVNLHLGNLILQGRAMHKTILIDMDLDANMDSCARQLQSAVNRFQSLQDVLTHGC